LSATAAGQVPADAAISYRIELADVNAHLFRVTLAVRRPTAEQRVSLPVWIPGSYLVREFARHLSELVARQGGRELGLQQVDKATWVAQCSGTTTLTLSYLVYAYDVSVRSAYLDARRGFFNGTSLCLRVHGREHEPHALALAGLPAGWDVATAMPGAGRRHHFVAADYDELVDHPFELGHFWRGDFVAGGVTHGFVVTGALPDFDGARLLEDTQRICEAQIAFWHGKAGADAVPFARYLFLLHAVDDGYGGLEHRASTALIARRRDLPGAASGADRSDGYVKLLGLVSHEYFHAWNVKRLRPSEFERYDYTVENYTELLWFFEGFTSYYDDLILLRAGLIDVARYLRLIATTASGVMATPGRKVQSLAQASFDAWVKYYRSDENTPNATISYYTLGALLALALDLSLRAKGKRGASLDAVMRRLWQRSGGGPVREADIAAAVAAVAGPQQGPALAAALVAWVHGTDELPLPDLLAGAGVRWRPQAPTLAQRWGLRVAESALTGVRVTHVLRGGAGETAGLAAGDELLAAEGWRLRRLEEAAVLLPAAGKARLLAARDQRLLELAIETATTASGNVLIDADEGAPAAARARRKAWLQA
jgi:predicted metalloprotease with PDZ domain